MITTMHASINLTLEARYVASKDNKGAGISVKFKFANKKTYPYALATPPGREDYVKAVDAFVNEFFPDFENSSWLTAESLDGNGLLFICMSKKD